METFDTQARIAVLETKVQNVAEKIEEMRVEQKEQHQALCSKFEDVAKRISVLEKWRFMIFGGAVVVGYLLAHIKVDKLF